MEISNTVPALLALRFNKVFTNYEGTELIVSVPSIEDVYSIRDGVNLHRLELSKISFWVGNLYHSTWSADGELLSGAGTEAMLKNIQH